MSIVNWKTWASGDVLTAADMNTYTRDNGRWLSHNATGGAPMCRVYRSTAQTGVADGALISFDSERFDPNAMHSVVTNTQRITIPSGGAGKYLFGATARLTATWDLSGTAEVGLYLQVNSTNFFAASSSKGEGAAGPVRHTPVGLYDFAVADFVTTIVAYQNQASVDVDFVGNYSPEFWAIWMGE